MLPGPNQSASSEEKKGGLEFGCDKNGSLVQTWLKTDLALTLPCGQVYKLKHEQRMLEQKFLEV